VYLPGEMTKQSPGSLARTGHLAQDTPTNLAIRSLQTSDLAYQLLTDHRRRLKLSREIARKVMTLSSRALPTPIWFYLGSTFCGKKTPSLT